MLDRGENDYTWDMVDDGDDDVVEDEVVVPRPSPMNPDYVPVDHTDRSDDEDDEDGIYNEARALIPDPPVRSDSTNSDNAVLVDEIDQALSEDDRREDDGDKVQDFMKDDDVEKKGDSASVSALLAESNTSFQAASELHDSGVGSIVADRGNEATGADDKKIGAAVSNNETNAVNSEAANKSAKEPPAVKFLRSVGWKPRHISQLRTWAHKSKEVVTKASKNVRNINPDVFDTVTNQTRQAAGTSVRYVKDSSRKLREWDEEKGLKVVPVTRQAASVLHSHARVIVHQLRKFEEEHRILAKSRLYLERSATTIQRFVRKHMRGRN